MNNKGKHGGVELMDEEVLAQVAGGIGTALDKELEKEMLSYQPSDILKSGSDKAAYDALKQANPTTENILNLLG